MFESGSSVVIRRIRALGLRVALEKTEAVAFHRPHCRLPEGAHIVLDGVHITVGPHMRYLGLVVDRQWNFVEHFRQLMPKLVGTASALSWLLPNLGEPGSSCRRLYAGVVRSMALYAAPVWAGRLTAPTRALLRRPQRVVAVRLVRGYRTVSFDAACLLAGTPPWELEAEVLAGVYRRRAVMRAGGVADPDSEVSRQWRSEAEQALLRDWKVRLGSAGSGLWTIRAIRPHFEEWIGRRHGRLSFRMVQVMSGHGCFGDYLHRVPRREVTPACHHCDSVEDTAQHTLEQCPAWEVQRRALGAALRRNDVSLSAIVAAVAGSEQKWEAFASFCEEVISQKEAAERVRRREAQPDPTRRTRMGARRRQYAALQPP